MTPSTFSRPSGLWEPRCGFSGFVTASGFTKICFGGLAAVHPERTSPTLSIRTLQRCVVGSKWRSTGLYELEDLTPTLTSTSAT